MQAGATEPEKRILALFGTFWPFFRPFFPLTDCDTFFDWSSGLGGDRSGQTDKAGLGVNPW